jgi:hypothetical protein
LQDVNGFWVVHTDCDSPCTCRQAGDQVPPGSDDTLWSVCDNVATTTTTTCNPATDNATWTCGAIALCPELPPRWGLSEDNCCEGKVPDFPVALCDCDNFASQEVVDCNDPVGSTSVPPTTTTSTTTTTTTP